MNNYCTQKYKLVHIGPNNEQQNLSWHHEKDMFIPRKVIYKSSMRTRLTNF